MCGIFGVITKQENNNKPSQLFETLLLESEKRGKEASGFALLNEKEQKVFVHKVPYSGKELIKGKIYKDVKKQLKTNSLFLGIGHSRLVTNGYEQFSHNNQPIIKEGLVVIHNGIIVNFEDLWTKYNQYKRQTDLDTEIIPVLLNHYKNENFNRSQSVSKMFDEIEGVANIAFIDSKSPILSIATNNGSLYYLFDKKAELFLFASESIFIENALKENGLTLDSTTIQQVQNKSLLEFDYDQFEIVATTTNGASASHIVIEEIELKFQSNQPINKSLEHDLEPVPEDFLRYFQDQKRKIAGLKRCNKCILPDTFPYIEFDSKGICNYCNNYKSYPVKGADELKKLTDSKRNTNNLPDVLIGLSGGRDSCYALHYVTKVLGLKAIAFSYDWGMLTDLARRNQSRMCAKLGVEHILISADIRKKRENIRKNVSAWLKRPHLGTIPLFMAGDKQYFYYANKIMDEKKVNLIFFGENLLESTFFKYGFCGIKPNLGHKEKSFSISSSGKMNMILFYLKEYSKNPAYINSSLIDSFGAFLSFYYIKHPYINLFHYLEWNEKTIIDTLINEYNWETDPETESTWRIGDGTAAFYNYIYYIVTGFSEYDTFRSNQIREGKISREEALSFSLKENFPRWESIQWYCKTVGIDWKEVIVTINKIKPLYGQ